MAEARREIVQALQLHRSSTRPAAASTVTTSAATSSSAQCCYYSLTEAIPIPEPIWSTTAPTIPAAPSSATAAAAVESLEFEWGESHASAYNWWLGFLKTLDSKINNIENYSTYPHSRLFGYQDNLKLGEGMFVDASDQQNTAPDEWLTFPASDDQQGDHTTTTNP